MASGITENDDFKEIRRHISAIKFMLACQLLLCMILLVFS